MNMFAFVTDLAVFPSFPLFFFFFFFLFCCNSCCCFCFVSSVLSASSHLVWFSGTLEELFFLTSLWNLAEVSVRVRNFLIFSDILFRLTHSIVVCLLKLTEGFLGVESKLAGSGCWLETYPLCFSFLPSFSFDGCSFGFLGIFFSLGGFGSFFFSGFSGLQVLCRS